MTWDRVIAHVDMDSFYVSVEVRDDPSLRGRAVVVGGDPTGRGVVSSASYEARRYGVTSAMPTARALRLCPDLVVIPPRPDKYATASRILRGIFDEFSPLVEPLSLDEAFLDLTGTQRLFGSPKEIGAAIRRRVVEELSLTASVGIATSKFVAKLASDHEKPDGLTIVPPDDEVAFVQSLPLERIWGVGPATLEALRDARGEGRAAGSQPGSRGSHGDAEAPSAGFHDLHSQSDHRAAHAGHRPDLSGGAFALSIRRSPGGGGSARGRRHLEPDRIGSARSLCNG
jgi:hypothetical protein